MSLRLVLWDRRIPEDSEEGQRWPRRSSKKKPRGRQTDSGWQRRARISTTWTSLVIDRRSHPVRFSESYPAKEWLGDCQRCPFKKLSESLATSLRRSNFCCCKIEEERGAQDVRQGKLVSYCDKKRCTTQVAGEDRRQKLEHATARWKIEALPNGPTNIHMCTCTPPYAWHFKNIREDVTELRR